MTCPGPAIRAARRVAAAAGTVLLGIGLTAGAAAPAQAASTGYVRLAHLSPDTPAVDVYLSKAVAGAKPQVFKAVGYGQLSQYLSVPPDRYAVAMRKAGAAASEPPVLTTEVTVAAGGAYTVAGVGRYADLGLRVLDDDLSSPKNGEAKVRVIQASVRAPVLDVAAANGPTVATGVQFATTTPYAQVQPGSWKLRLQPPGAAPTSTDVALHAGTVYSLLVLDAKTGGLTTELRVDARGGGVVPVGGVDTGAGGTAARGGPSYPLVTAGVLLVGLVAAGGLLLRRRVRRTW